MARLYELFPWRGQLAISQEYIAGRSLERHMASGPIDIGLIRRYLRYICSALNTAHKLGVVHQDFKPANIVIDANDRPHILDFGIAILKSTRSFDDAPTANRWPTSREHENSGRANSRSALPRSCRDPKPNCSSTWR